MNERNKGKRLNQYRNKFVVFDLETTGINVYRDKIIEISAVKVEDETIIDTFDTLINPEMPIPRGATAVNGITNEMVKDAPVLEEVMPAFLEFIEGWTLVGHNIHSFDLNFVYDYALEICDIHVQNDYVDTLYMSRQCLPELKHHKLTDISDYFGISTTGAHRALSDCQMNCECYIRLGKLKTRDTTPAETCPVCGCDMKVRKGKFGEFMGCTGFPKCRFTKNI